MKSSPQPTPTPPPPPPPPPPPRSPPRYMLTIPFHSKLGFELEPLLPSHDPSRCTGAKVSYLDPLHHRNMKHNVQIGDIIYKINGVVTRNRSFNCILDNIRSSLHDNDRESTESVDGVTFIFEKALQKNESVEISPSKNANTSNNFSTSKDDASKSSHSHTPKKSVRLQSHLSSPSSVDVSREVNVLESIFHRRKLYEQKTSQNSFTSDDTIDEGEYNTHGSSQNFQRRKEPSSPSVDLMCIPEYKSIRETQDNHERTHQKDSRTNSRYSPSSSGSRHSDDTPDEDYVCHTNDSPEQSSLRHLKQWGDDAVNHYNSDVKSTTFEYSTSTLNPNTPRRSPLGTNIAINSNSDRRKNDRPRTVSWNNDTTLSKSYLSSDSAEFIRSEISHSHRSKESNQLMTSYDNTTPCQVKNIVSDDDDDDTTNFHTPLEGHKDDDTPLMDSLSVSTVFMSPLSRMGGSIAHSTREKKIHNYSTVPVAMLDYEHIRNCNCLEELQSIVQTLGATSPPEFPALLRVAQKRLGRIQKYCSPDKQATEDPQSAEQLKVDLGSRVKDDANEKMVAESQKPTADEKIEDEQEENFNVNEMDNGYMKSIEMAHAEKTDILEKVIQERNEMQLHLSSQVEILQDTLQALEDDMEMNARDAINKIDHLEKAKKDAEINLEKEQMALAASSKEARAVLAELKSRTMEVDTLTEELERERSNHSIALQKSHAVQLDLRAKVENLTNQLKIQVEETEVTHQLMEMKIEAEYKEMSELDKEVINYLEEQLSSAKEQLKILSEENSRLTEQNMSSQEKNNYSRRLTEVLKEFAAAESCADALAKALAESEAQMSSAILAYERMEELLYSVMEERSAVKEQNKELSGKIIEMECELESSHKCIDDLRQLNGKREQEISHQEKCNDWESIKKKYEEKILELRLHISTIDAKAVDEANAAAKQIEKLCEKVRTLEKLLNERNNNSENTHSSGGNGRKNINSNASKSIKIYSDPQTSFQNIEGTRSVLPMQSLRSSVLRANGGRAGLAAKLKKTREQIQLAQKAQAKEGKGIIERNPLQPHQENRLNARFGLYAINSMGKENINVQ